MSINNGNSPNQEASSNPTPHVMGSEEKYAIVRSIGEECIQEDELRNLLAKNPEPICYDGVEPYGRMHIAQFAESCINYDDDYSDDDDDDSDDDEDDRVNDDNDRDESCRWLIDYDLIYYDLIYLNKALANDDVPKFRVAIQNMFDDLKHGERCMCTSEIMRAICYSGALSCATALLQDETFLIPDLNYPIGITYPLNRVASSMDRDMVDLFLRHGAQTDSRSKDLLPLEEALKKLRKHNYLFEWNPDDSILKLVIILCLPQMEIALETIRLLALSTKVVNEIFVYHVKQGNLIQMAVLLMVANECIMAPRIFENKDDICYGGTTSCDVIMGHDLQWLDCEKWRKLGQVCKGKRAAWKSKFMLFKLFDCVGEAIRSYLRSRQGHLSKEGVVKDVASILTEAGFVLESKDIDLSNINCDEIKESSGTSENVRASKVYLDMFFHEPYTDVPREKEATIACTFEEASCVLKHKEIDLTSIGSESNEVKDAMTSSDRFTRSRKADASQVGESCYRELVKRLDSFLICPEKEDVGCSVQHIENIATHIEKYPDILLDPLDRFPIAKDPTCLPPILQVHPLWLSSSSSNLPPSHNLNNIISLPVFKSQANRRKENYKSVQRFFFKSCNILPSLALSIKRIRGV